MSEGSDILGSSSGMVLLEKLGNIDMANLRRNKLKKMIEKGLLIAKCESQYTDDYKLDVATNFGKTDYKPCKIKDSAQTDFSDDIKFYDCSFTSKCGYAQKCEDGTIYFKVSSNESYRLKAITNS